MKHEEKLQEAKRLYKSANSDQKYVLESLFPELRESEDERIRKNIISWLKNIEGQTIPINEYNSAIDWLEKQGKQKPFDYENVNIPQRDFAPKSAMEAINEEKVDNANKVIVKPIFKIGDFIVDNCGYIWKIVGIINQFYILEGVEGGESRPTIEFVNQTFHLWTIKDAKDGDVLELDCGIGIFKDKCIDGYNIHCYCYYSNEGVLEINKDSLYDTYQSNPATKEQREQLEKAMADAGYTFDFEKKELKEMEHKVKTKFHEGDIIQFKGFGHNRYTIKEVCGLSHYINTMGNRMEMSYTDANFEVINEIEIPLSAKDSELQEATYFIPKGFHAEIDDDKVVIKKGKQKPTDEEMKEALRTEYEKGRADAIAEMQKSAWSEENIATISRVISIVKWAAYSDHSHPILNDEGATELVERLNSIKDKCTWKPSVEQINTLEYYMHLICSEDKEILFGLYTDLKKLIEE